VKAQEFKEMSEAELRQKEKDLTAELFNLRFQHATGQRKIPRLPQVRRICARQDRFAAKDLAPARPVED
jgi:large subunit ribosomal protein L29